MKNIKTNSKHVNKNDIFICTHDNFNRHQFIDDAINNGSGAIIVDEDLNCSYNVPIIKVCNTNDTLFQIANDFYKRPFDKLKLIGITGTDGKTTTASLTRDLLNNFYKCAYLGTNGFIVDDEVINTNNTTPSIVEILKYASIALDKGCSYLVMEVSSEGLLHNRCANLLFDVVCLTNISCDHLNVHKSFDNYLKSKAKLFKLVKKNSINVINIDDEYNSYFDNLNDNKTIFYGKDSNANLSINNIILNDKKTFFELKYNDELFYLESPLLGSFNVYNLVCALCILLSLGIDINDAIKYVDRIKIPLGRMNVIGFGQNFTIILDYAHTTWATYNVLSFANKVKKERIITVVGCAGGRYKEKRKEIGQLVSKYSDIVIFTMDDPRYEKLDDIFNDMLENVKNSNVITIKNRKKAIKKAISLASKDDIILILGKGRDNYMAVKGKYKKYNDYKIIKKILR